MILTRDEVIDRLNETIVVPITRTIRGLSTEVVLTPEEGMPVVCALNFDHLALALREHIGAPITHLREDRWPEVRKAILLACEFRDADRS